MENERVLWDACKRAKIDIEMMLNDDWEFSKKNLNLVYEDLIKAMGERTIK